MQRTGEHFGACNLQPRGSGSNKPRSQMHLQTCWVKFLPEIQTDRAAQPIWQKTRGQCMNFNVRWVGWKFIRALMKQVWWQNFWKIRLMISKQTYCICSMIFSTLEIFHHVGAGRFFRCWRRRRGLNNHQLTGPLQTQDLSGCHNLEGNAPSISEILAEATSPTTADSQPPRKETGLDLALSYAHPGAADIKMASIVRADMLGDWPVKQSLLLNVLRSKRRGGKKKASVCCTKHLPSGFWVALKHSWKHISRKNNTVSDNIDGWMNTCWLQHYFWTRLGTREFQCGL